MSSLDVQFVSYLILMLQKNWFKAELQLAKRTRGVPWIAILLVHHLAEKIWQ